MTLPREDDVLFVRQERLNAKLKSYLMVLASSHPFGLDISAKAPLLFEELRTNWPEVDGWEKQALTLRHRIGGLASPFIDPDYGDFVRLIVNARAIPQITIPTPKSPAVYAVFDAAQGIMEEGLLPPDQMHARPALDDIALGMAVLCQPLHEQSDARPVELGAPPEIFPLTDNQEQRLADKIAAEQAGSFGTMLPMPPPIQPPIKSAGVPAPQHMMQLSPDPAVLEPGLGEGELPKA